MAEILFFRLSHLLAVVEVEILAHLETEEQVGLAAAAAQIYPDKVQVVPEPLVKVRLGAMLLHQAR
jgi:hypothetical protein